MKRKRPQKHNKSLLLKKTEEKLQRKNAKSLESFFFRSKFLFRENHTTEEENFVIKERSLFKQQQKQQHEKRGQKREENKTRENHGTRGGLLSLLLFAFLLEGVKVVRWKKEEEEQKKHQSSSVDKDFSGCIIIRAFKQHERGGRFRGRVFR